MESGLLLACHQIRHENARLLAHQHIVFDWHGPLLSLPTPTQKSPIIFAIVLSTLIIDASLIDVLAWFFIRYDDIYEDGGRRRKPLELKGIQEHSVEIMSIESCSLYEFRITAVSKYGESKPVVLVQYTGRWWSLHVIPASPDGEAGVPLFFLGNIPEPQLSPQHIIAKKLNVNTIELSWEPPYKRTNEVKVTRI